MSRSPSQIGSDIGSEGAVTVTGTGSLWANSRQIDVGTAGTGTLTVANGGVVSSLRGFIGTHLGSNGAVTVTGEGSAWTNDESIVVGFSGNGVLEIYDGGTVEGAEGYLGAGVSGSGSVIVSGAGSQWINSDVLAVGYAGSGSLLVEDGGQVTSASGVISDMDGSSGEAIVTGEGSAWTMDGELRVGSGDDGSLTIADGGYVSNVAGHIGYEADAEGIVTVTGENSHWQSDFSLNVGTYGHGTLRIEDGGTVATDGGVFAGYYTDGFGAIDVSGSGSSLTTGSLIIGWAGSGSLAVSDGATVTSGGAHLAFEPGQQGVATISGAGSTWTSERIIVVKSGTGILTVEDGGAVIAQEFDVGSVIASGVGRVLVTGAGSTLKSREISIEGTGTATIAVENGGLLEADDGQGVVVIAPNAGTIGSLVVGADPDLPGYDPQTDLTAPGVVNAAAVSFGDGDPYGDGNGMLVFNHSDETGDYEFAPAIISGDPETGTIEHLAGYTNLTGDSSGFTGMTYVDGGVLAITGGGVLGGVSGSVGHSTGSEAAALVSGAGSSWMVSEELDVGYGGAGTLTIADGGYVSSAGGNIGYEADATGNATVTGAGSTWFNGTGADAKIVYVGYFGSGELTIEDSGQMDGGVLYMATAPDSYGHLTVTGPGSAWTNHQLSQIGIQGTAEILIEDGGTITQGEGNVFLGTSPDGVGAVTVTGAGSAWTNMYFFGVGGQGTGSLTVSDGGLVSGRIAMLVANSAGSYGTVNIGAAAGEAPVAPGVIDFPSVDFYTGEGRLVFNHTDETGDYEFSPSITSSARNSTIAHYAGFTRLTGDGSYYLRTTDVYGGTLAIDNALGGQVNVLSGGALTGTGVAAGNVTFNSGSTYLVDMDGTVDPQGLTVSGLATLAGSVVIEGDYMAVAGEGPVVILTTDTTLTTTFDSAEVASVFFTPSLSYEMDGGTDYVYVSIEQDKTFSDFADTRNRLAVAGGLESLTSDHPLAATMLTLTNEGVVVDAYDQLSGEVHASLKGALIENGQQAVKAVNNRIHDAFEADANSSVAAYGDTHDPASGFWITGYGDWMSTEATGNTAAMDNALYGVIAGVDHQFGDHFRFGVLGGYSRTDTTIDALSSEAEADSYTIGLYGGADNGQAGLSLGALYTWHSIDSRRYVTNPVTEELAADYDAGSFQLFAEAGYKVAMEQATIEPFAGVSYINLQTDSFAESGGLAALSSPSQSTSTTFTTLGLRSSMTFASNVHARGMIGWRHAFGDVDPASTMTIGGGSPFTIVGAPIAQDAAVVEAGIDIKAGQNVMIGASYEGQYGDGAIANGFNARFLATF